MPSKAQCCPCQRRQPAAGGLTGGGGRGHSRGHAGFTKETLMRFGLFTSMGGQTWSGVLELWKHLEATGWDIACVTDHFLPNTKEREGAMLESWSTLSALAALVPRLRVGTIVLGNTYRHPRSEERRVGKECRSRWSPSLKRK